MNEQGTVIASGSTDKIIRLYDTRDGKKLIKLRGHQDTVRQILLQPDGHTVCFFSFY